MRGRFRNCLGSSALHKTSKVRFLLRDGFPLIRTSFRLGFNLRCNIQSRHLNTSFGGRLLLHILVGFIWVRQSSLWFNSHGFCCINMLDLLSVGLDIVMVVLVVLQSS